MAERTDQRRRQRLRTGLVSLVVVLVATALGVHTSSSAAPTAAVARAAASAPAGPVGTGGARAIPLDFGVAYGDTLPFDSDQQLDSALNDAVTLGATWVRTDLSWEDIQPDGPGSYDWQRFDRVVEAARARGLNVLPTIGYTPPWERSPDCSSGQNCAPVDPNAFAAFARTAAARYAPMGVHTWEIWNEPNIPFWGPKPDPEAYTALLRVTAKAIRAVDPKAFLLMGGLAAVSTDAKINYVSATDFLAAVSKLGANRLVNAISYHPYTYPYLPSATTSFGTAFQRISSYGSVNLEAVLTKYGTPNLPVWITETGAPTNGPGAAADGTTIPPNATDVTEAFQAEIATDTVKAAAANPYVGAVFWFSDQDTGTPAQKASRSLFYGLRRYDGTEKPAFTAFKNAIAAYEKSQLPAPAP